MAQLRRAKSDDQHLYIMLGPSKGTRQITKAGVDWLKKQEYFLPSAGGWVNLDPGTYRYLDNYGHLYIKGEEYTRSPTQDLLPLLPPEAVQYGPPLLLQLADNHQAVGNAEVEWKLVLKLDEWEERARNALLRNCAAAVGCYVSFETDAASIFSSISLQQILNVDCWPEVAPKEGDYVLYWQTSELFQEESQSAIPLHEATPIAGLKPGWQGNVFFRLGGLVKAWKRYLPDMSISARGLTECYWLAQSNQEPEPSWPGKAQRLGRVKQGWQLWHLQADQKTDMEDVAEWFSYRQIRLNYPAWRLNLLNPLSIVSEREYTCMPSQHLLVRCDPPTSQTESMQASPRLSLTPYAKSTTGRQRLPGSPVQSPRFGSNSDGEQYFCVPAPPPYKQYGISMSGGASVQSLWAQTSQLSTQLPGWLHGLSCSVSIAGKRYTMRAFSSEPASKPHIYRLSVEIDFSLAQLGEATWSYQPSGIPCSLCWEYLSSQGERCQAKSPSIQTETALTNWWQTAIWPNVTGSPWVTLTFDAASFGSIHLKLVLQPEAAARRGPKSNANRHLAISEQELKDTAHSSAIQEVKRSSAGIAPQAWWLLPDYTAHFLWLSRMIGQDATPVPQVASPELSLVLEQLCVPDLPAALKNALLRLATSRNMPIWIYLRLQVLLAALHSTVEPVAEERL